VVSRLRIAALMVLSRQLVRHPVATAVMMLSLSIGTAVSALTFIVAWTMFVRPLPYANDSRLVTFWASASSHGLPRLELTWQEVEALQHRSSLEGLAAFAAVNNTAVVRNGQLPIQLASNVVSRGFFETLGVRAAMGRLPVAADHLPEAPIVVVLTWDAWHRHFDADPNVIGRKLTSGDQSAEVIGVLPAHVDFPRGAEVLLPHLPLRHDADRLNRVWAAVGRLAPGVSLAAVAADARQAASELHAGASQDRDVTIETRSLRTDVLGPVRDAVRILLLMGMLVLAVALLNVAAVALVRGTRSSGELGIHCAVGATRAAIARRRFRQTIGATALACAAGWLMAAAAIETMRSLAPRDIPRLAEIDASLASAVFALLVAIIAAALSAIVQTSSVTEREMANALAPARSTSTRRTMWVLELLAVGQVAVAIVTIVVAALLVENFRGLVRLDPGFRTEGVLTFHLPLGYTLPDDREAAHAWFDELLGRLRALPGVVAAGSVLMRPLEIEHGWDVAYRVEGAALPQHGQPPAAGLLVATPGYFESMGIELLEGRGIEATDTARSTLAVVVSESFARRFWPRAPAVGRRVRMGEGASTSVTRTVVGVVNDVRNRGLAATRMDLYVPFSQSNWSPNYFAVRTTGDPRALLPSVRAVVARSDQELPVASPRTTADLIEGRLASPRVGAILGAVLAAAASLLAAIGLGGVLACSAGERSRELGVRMAMGAHGGLLLLTVMRRALWIGVAGTAVGLVLSVAAERMWVREGWSQAGIDLSGAMAIAALVSVAIVTGSIVPALRVVRADPAQALRGD